MSESEVQSEFSRLADPKLKQRVEENLPVFLKWLVEGVARWYSNSSISFKIMAPPAVLQATKEYTDKYDTLAPFMRARCIRGADLKVTTCDLLEAYNAYYAGSSRKAIGARELAEMMCRHHFHSAENIGRKSLTGYNGLSLK
jgi:phage/plasmid-associated DNA primase